MPVKYLENQAEFNLFKAELRAKFQENRVSFHVCKDIHGDEECHQCNAVEPYGVVSQGWDQPTFFVIYINPHLYERVFEYFTQLIIDHPLHEDEDEDDVDGNSHIETIFMCPYCGTDFASQD